MIIQCPGCRKQVSSKSELCSHCGFALGDVSEEQVDEFHRRRLRDRIYHLKMFSYAAITLLLAACGWYWWESGDFGSPPSAGPVLLVVLGAAAYLVIRVLLFMARRELRALR
ncbi:MAG: hypothetical protein P8008_07600 [Gammaproteobacteria bacterium]